MATVLRYACNCFWLLVPILLLNAFYTRRRPKAYQPEVFWRDIPAGIAIGEKVLRFAVFLLPLLMPLGIGTTGRKTGMAVYLAGLILYFAAWGMQVYFPRSRWSTGVFGFMAPAYRPPAWCVGIGLVYRRTW